MTNKITNILVPVNFSETSLNALNSAIKMAKRHAAHLHLLQVMDNEHIFPTAGMQAPALSISEEIIESEQDNLMCCASSIERNHKIKCSAYYTTGWLIPTITKMAGDLYCEIIVIGIDPKGAHEPYLTDSIAYKVLKNTCCPVLTIPKQKKTNTLKRMVLPIRPVHNTLQKIEVAKPLILKNKSSVHIVGAFEKAGIMHYGKIRSLVSEAKGKMKKEDIPYSYEVSFGKNTADNILKLSKDISADVIVITASTKRNFRQFFFGNYAQKIINNTHTAVLCVKQDVINNSKNTTFMFSHSMLA